MKFAAIQFIDCLSESIRDKNLLDIDGRPLWSYNAKLLHETKHGYLKAMPTRNVEIGGFYITTNYAPSVFDAYEHSDEINFVPQQEFNVHKCPLSERVKDAVNYVKKCDNFDAYILLLGNSRCFRSHLLYEMIELYSIVESLNPITGMLPVASMPMLSPYRAMGINEWNVLYPTCTDANSLTRQSNYSRGEDRHDSENCSWFYTGGPMIMSNRVKVPEKQEGWSNRRHRGTYFPYLGDKVFGYRIKPRDCMELDAAWQLPMMSDEYNELELAAKTRRQET